MIVNLYIIVRLNFFLIHNDKTKQNAVLCEQDRMGTNGGMFSTVQSLLSSDGVPKVDTNEA